MVTRLCPARLQSFELGFAGFSPGLSLVPWEPFDHRLIFGHQIFDDAGFKADSVATDRLAAASPSLKASFSACLDLDGFAISRAFLFPVSKFQ